MSAQKDDQRPLKLGVATLVACVVQTLNESDHTFRPRFVALLDRAYAAHREKEDIQLLELLSWTRELGCRRGGGWNLRVA